MSSQNTTKPDSSSSVDSGCFTPPTSAPTSTTSLSPSSSSSSTSSSNGIILHQNLRPSHAPTHTAHAHSHSQPRTAHVYPAQPRTARTNPARAPSTTLAHYLREQARESPWSPVNLRDNPGPNHDPDPNPSSNISRAPVQPTATGRAPRSAKPAPAMQRYLAEKPGEGPWSATSLRGGGADGTSAASDVAMQRWSEEKPGERPWNGVEVVERRREKEKGRERHHGGGKRR